MITFLENWIYTDLIIWDIAFYKQIYPGDKTKIVDGFWSSTPRNVTPHYIDQKNRSFNQFTSIISVH